MSKEKVNKSEHVRVLLREDPKMTAKDIIAKLADKGIKVNASLIYFIKGNMKEKTRRRTRVAKAARAASSANSNGDPVILIREVKTLATKAGGFEKLRELVEALAE